MKAKIKEVASWALIVSAILPLVYSAVAWVAFQVRNPAANKFTYFTHFRAVHRFERVPGLQGE